MAPEPGGGPDKLSIIAFSGAFEKVHYALALASAAVAVNRRATLFFTMEAIHGLKRAGADGRPGWAALDCAEGAEARDARFGQQGVARYEELLEACAALGVTFMVCEMGLRAVGLTLSDLRQDLSYREGGIVTFLNDASDKGAMLFV